MRYLRFMTSMIAVIALAGAAIAQGDVRTAPAKGQSSVVPHTSDAAKKASKASPDPTKVDLKKQENEKLKKAALVACRQMCHDNYPISPSNTSQKATASGKDPCAGLPELTGAYMECTKKQLEKAAAKSAGQTFVYLKNKPKHEACMKKCDRGT
jgi:hypothetical protein